MKKVKAIIVGLAVGLSFANLLGTAASLLMGELWSMNILYETNIMVVFLSVSAALILKEKVSPLEKWIRRAAVMILWFVAYYICLLAFGHFGYTCGHINYDMFFKVMAITFPLMITVFIICYIVGDRIERKYLEGINKKLFENTFWGAFKSKARKEEETESFEVYSFEYENTDYTVLKVLKKANDRTVIRLEEEKILWEQAYPLFNRPAREEWVIARKSFVKKGTVGVIIFNGTPLNIIGLDENGYISVNNKVRVEGDIYVLTSAEVNTFEP